MGLVKRLHCVAVVLCQIPQQGQPQLRLTLDTARPVPEDMAMLKRLQQAWKREPLTVAALGSVAMGFLMWAAPLSLTSFGFNQSSCITSIRENIVLGTETVVSLLLVRVYSGCDYFRVDFAGDWFQFERLPAVLFFFTLAAFLYWYGNRATIVGNIRGR
jgi:hypothetical protein